CLPPRAPTSRLSSFPSLSSPRDPHPAHLPSFPTRRSSDLDHSGKIIMHGTADNISDWNCDKGDRPEQNTLDRSKDRTSTCNVQQDRKSTRLNSSHVSISYAVFCLKKKRRERQQRGRKTTVA